MTDDRDLPDDMSALAGEYALGLLEGSDRVEAGRLAAVEPRFREAVARWLGQLAPLLEEIESVAPPADSWNRIQAQTGGGSQPGNVHLLRRKVSVWRGVAGVMTALAASLALVVALHPPSRPATPAPAPSLPAAAPMVARLSSDDRVALVASWDAERQQLLLAAAAGMPVKPGRSHELWIIPAGAQPQSLGVMPETNQAVMHLPARLGVLMRAGATLAVSVEPMGGSPTGAPTGPVVASGSLETT